MVPGHVHTDKGEMPLRPPDIFYVHKIAREFTYMGRKWLGNIRTRRGRSNRREDGVSPWAPYGRVLI